MTFPSLEIIHLSRFSKTVNHASSKETVLLLDLSNIIVFTISFLGLGECCSIWNPVSPCASVLRRLENLRETLQPAAFSWRTNWFNWFFFLMITILPVAYKLWNLITIQCISALLSICLHVKGQSTHMPLIFIGTWRLCR